VASSARETTQLDSAKVCARAASVADELRPVADVARIL
jgi:hypothetical protein